jgi:hypothetical protein
MSGSEHNKGIKESKERKIDVLNENEEDEKEMTLSKDDKVKSFHILKYFLNFRSRHLTCLPGLH